MYWRRWADSGAQAVLGPRISFCRFGNQRTLVAGFVVRLASFRCGVGLLVRCCRTACEISTSPSPYCMTPRSAPSNLVTGSPPPPLPSPPSPRPPAAAGGQGRGPAGPVLQVLWGRGGSGHVHPAGHDGAAKRLGGGGGAGGACPCLLGSCGAHPPLSAARSYAAGGGVAVRLTAARGCSCGLSGSRFLPAQCCVLAPRGEAASLLWPPLPPLPPHEP